MSLKERQSTGSDSTRASDSESSPGVPERTERIRAHLTTDDRLCATFADHCRIDPANLVCRRMVVRMVRMLHLCDYEMATIVQVLALALAQLDTVFQQCDERMDIMERSCIAILQCYNAHAYLLDEACPLKYWQQNIYSDYCDVKVLNSAVMKLMRLIKYNLFVPEAKLKAKTELLEQGMGMTIA